MTRPAGYGTPSAGKHSGDARRPPLLRTMVGDVLRRTRLEQGRTLADVAGAARVSMAYLSEVERGRKEASSEILAAICDALRVELADLLAMVGAGLAPRRSAGVSKHSGLAPFGFGPERTADPIPEPVDITDEQVATAEVIKLTDIGPSMIARATIAPAATRRDAHAQCRAA